MFLEEGAKLSLAALNTGDDNRIRESLFITTISRQQDNTIVCRIWPA
jgi:hypothetical protein